MKVYEKDKTKFKNYFNNNNINKQFTNFLKDNY